MYAIWFASFIGRKNLDKRCKTLVYCPLFCCLTRCNRGCRTSAHNRPVAVRTTNKVDVLLYG